MFWVLKRTVLFWLRNKKIIVCKTLLTKGLMPIKNSQLSVALSTDVLSHDGMYFFCRASESVSVAIDGRVGQMTGLEKNG